MAKRPAAGATAKTLTQGGAAHEAASAVPRIAIVTTIARTRKPALSDGVVAKRRPAAHMRRTVPPYVTVVAIAAPLAPSPGMSAKFSTMLNTTAPSATAACLLGTL